MYQQSLANPYTLRTLAVALWQHNKLREAHTAIADAVSYNPLHVPSLLCLGVMTYLMNDKNGAEEVLREAVRIARWKDPSAIRIWAQVNKLRHS